MENDRRASESARAVSRSGAILLILLTVLGVSSCKDDSVGPTTRVVGAWGGNHVVLTVDRLGGALEFDCADGTIDGPIAVDSSGRFARMGTYTRAPGGPAHMGDPPDTHPARYEGTVVGDTLTLSVTLTDTGQSLGSYTLVRDARGDIHRCV